MRCPDCKKEVGYNKLYCPHCSAELFDSKEKLTNVTLPVYKVFELNAAMR
jgi:hypothetical protein